MSRKHKFHNPDGVFFVTLTIRDWIDVFTRNEYKDILIENLRYCQQNKGLEIFAWCIMTNHLHMIVRAKDGFELPGILRDYKKFTGKAILVGIRENPQESRKEWLTQQFSTPNGNRFWQEGNHPVELWSNAVIDQKINYIHQNPVEEGLVFRAEDYRYSSALDYAGENGMLDIFVIK